MARILGEAGKYVLSESHRSYRRMLVVGMLCLGITCWLGGFMLGTLFEKKFFWSSLVINALALALVLALRWWGFRYISRLERKRDDYLRGAKGEISVGQKLLDLPDGFYVISDLNAENGNLDHVVIGPTGVYALDVKNWRGIVSASQQGELLLNGNAEQPHLKQFVGRIMSVWGRIKALAPELNFFIQPVFVFTSARVEANWGTTGPLHCITDDQLYDYIVESKQPRKLDNKTAVRIGRAFAALARMDPEFTDKVTASTPPNLPQKTSTP